MSISPMLAEAMLRFAKRIVAVQQEKLSTPYPPASKPGQYPRRRTGNLMRSVDVRPRTVREIERTGQMRIGYLQRAWYGVILEFDMERLTLADTINGLLGGRSLPDGLTYSRDRSTL